MAQQDTQAAGSGQTIKTHPLLDLARDLVITDQKASISYVQRKLKVGYNDAATLLDTLELEGVVSQLGPDFTRTVLVTKTAGNGCNAPVMAQQFTHTATAPHSSETAPHQRYFAAGFLSGRSGAGYHPLVIRMADEDVARLEISTWGHQDVRVEVMTKLDADQCEALARYLLDAAADLRAHSAAELIAANTEHNPDEVPE